MSGKLSNLIDISIRFDNFPDIIIYKSKLYLNIFFNEYYSNILLG